MTPQEAYNVLATIAQQALAQGAFKTFEIVDKVQDALATMRNLITDKENLITNKKQ